MKNKIVFTSTSIPTRCTLMSSRINGYRYFRNGVLTVADGARTFSGKRELPKTLFMKLKQQLQKFFNYIFRQIIYFGNFLNKNLLILHYIINHIIIYQIVRLRNVFMFYVRVAGWQNTLTALFREPLYFIPLLLYGLGGIVSILFGIGFIDDPHSMQLSSCHTEMTSLVTGALTDFDAVRFKNSMNYILHFAQDPELRSVVKKMCQIYERKIDLQYNMQKVYPAWTEQHDIAIAESQDPYLFVAKICLATILGFLILILLNINGDAFVPPIQDLPEEDVISPISLGSSIDGRTTSESPVIEGWND